LKLNLEPADEKPARADGGGGIVQDWQVGEGIIWPKLRCEWLLAGSLKRKFNKIVFFEQILADGVTLT
jgi:hypothetical protein